MTDYKELFIGGEWVAPTGQGRIEVISPVNEEVYGTVPDATEAEILKLCAEARQNAFASVCVNPGWVRLCAQQLKGSKSMVCTVVGFPLGATSTAANQGAIDRVRFIVDGRAYPAPPPGTLTRAARSPRPADRCARRRGGS